VARRTPAPDCSPASFSSGSLSSACRSRGCSASSVSLVSAFFAAGSAVVNETLLCLVHTYSGLGGALSLSYGYYCMG